MIDNDWALIDLITGYQPAAVVTTALRLGVFETLGRVPTRAEDLAAKLAADSSNLAALLEALCSLGLVGRSADGYAATSLCGPSPRPGRADGSGRSQGSRLRGSLGPSRQGNRGGSSGNGALEIAVGNPP